NPPLSQKKFQVSPHLTSRYQCTKLFTENYKRKEILIPTGPWIRSLSNPVGRVQGLVFHIAAPPPHFEPYLLDIIPLLSVTLREPSAGNVKVPIHFLPGDRFLGNIVHSSPGHLSRHRSWSSQLGRRKFRQTQSRASASVVPSDCSISKFTLLHHAKHLLSNADTKVQSNAKSRHCVRRVINFFHKNINAPISGQTAAVKRKLKNV
ncbi:hypothetical protein AVEN_75339-1, partial [Araneus ventricosus]